MTLPNMDALRLHQLHKTCPVGIAEVSGTGHQDFRAVFLADAYIPLDELFAQALKTQPEPKFYSADGVHPNANGAEFIGKHYFEAIAPFIESFV